MSPEFIADSKAKLEKEKKRLEALLGHVAHRDQTAVQENYATDFPNVGDSMDENAKEVELYATNLGEEKALEARLQKIITALSRIANNSFGRCVIGGEEIEADRLRIAPEAETCVKHSS
ncbi:MAG: hypothetical protein HY397_02100 [Candidatus Doudnabacteria bacterium]|nr:hypothetical protein [Candidatus Doudnabacteria bacterium]